MYDDDEDRLGCVRDAVVTLLAEHLRLIHNSRVIGEKSVSCVQKNRSKEWDLIEVEENGKRMYVDMSNLRSNIMEVVRKEPLLQLQLIPSSE